MHQLFGGWLELALLFLAQPVMTGNPLISVYEIFFEKWLNDIYTNSILKENS